MYDVPGSHITKVIIDSKVIANEKPAIYLSKDQEHLGQEIIEEDDGVENKHEGNQQQITHA